MTVEYDVVNYSRNEDDSLRYTELNGKLTFWTIEIWKLFISFQLVRNYQSETIKYWVSNRKQIDLNSHMNEWQEW